MELLRTLAEAAVRFLGSHIQPYLLSNIPVIATENDKRKDAGGGKGSRELTAYI